MSNKRKILMVFSSETKSFWLKKKVKKLSSKFNEIIIVANGEQDKDFSDYTYLQYKCLDDFIASEIINQGRKYQVDFVVNISKQILSSKSMKTEFIMNNMNTWWFLPNKIFGQIRDQDFISKVDAISNVLEHFNPSLVVFDMAYKNSGLLQEICEKRQFKFKTQKTFLKNAFRKSYEFFLNLMIGPKRWIDSQILWNWSRKSVKKSSFEKSSKPIICYLTHAPYIRLGYTIEGKIEKHDVYQKNILLKINEMGEFDHYSLEVLNDLSERKAFNEIHKIRTFTKNIPINNFHSLSISNKTSKYRRISHRRLNKLFRNKEFKDIFSYKGISLLDIYKFRMFRMFKTEMSNACETTTLFQKALQDLNPKIIVLHNEHASFGKSLIYVAKKMQIPTVAIQHGFINFASPEYFISDNMICKDTETNLAERCNHLASSTFVHGERTKNLLIKHGGYSKERVKVVGCPQWDIILRKEYFRKQEFLRKLGFNEETKTIAILSQALPVLANRVFFNKKITKTIKDKFSNLQIIWKPHPRENTQEISNLVKNQYNLTNVIVRKDLPLFDVLNACDLVITIHSTTALEAMLFNKPVVTFIPPGEIENDLFKNTGAVIKVETENELIEAIKQSLYDENIQNNLKIKRNNLVKDLVKFDGNASLRTAKMILQMIKK